MRVISRVQELDVSGCVLVPTMGALHAGHEALIRRGVQLAKDRGLAAGCVVSIYVNPAQFNEGADYDRYPRTLDQDRALAEACGASAVWEAITDEVYPPGQDRAASPIPAVATEPGLEDNGRPGHLEGVCKVCSRLFELTQPSAAVFGEKDWQQLQVVRAMVRSERRDMEIIPSPTIREPDGLALSSRNRFVCDEDRPRALGISRALQAAGLQPTVERAEAEMRRILSEAGVEPAYAVVRDAVTLMPPTPGTTEHRALITAEIGGVRLLDNAPWPWAG